MRLLFSGRARKIVGRCIDVTQGTIEQQDQVKGWGWVLTLYTQHREPGLQLSKGQNQDMIVQWWPERRRWKMSKDTRNVAQDTQTWVTGLGACGQKRRQSQGQWGSNVLCGGMHGEKKLSLVLDGEKNHGADVMHMYENNCDSGISWARCFQWREASVHAIVLCWVLAGNMASSSSRPLLGKDGLIRNHGLVRFGQQAEGQKHVLHTWQKQLGLITPEKGKLGEYAGNISGD